MPDQVSTLATALSASITAGTVTPTQLTTLSTAIVGGGQALAVSRASRRAGILNGVLNPLTLPLGATVASIAQSWSEVVEANVFLASAQSVDGSLNILRAFDTQGPLLAMIANIPAAAFTFWSNALVALASQFEALETETLPS